MVRIETEKRRTPRFPLAANVSAVIFPGLASADTNNKHIRGVAKDVGSGGIRITADQPLVPGTVLRCEIALHAMSVGIPTLLRVCWAETSATEGQYDLGLLFLI